MVNSNGRTSCLTFSYLLSVLLHPTLAPPCVVNKRFVAYKSCVVLDISAKFQMWTIVALPDANFAFFLASCVGGVAKKESCLLGQTHTNTWANTLNEKNLITPGSVICGSRQESIELRSWFGNNIEWLEINGEVWVRFIRGTIWKDTGVKAKMLVTFS